MRSLLIFSTLVAAALASEYDQYGGYREGYRGGNRQRHGHHDSYAPRREHHDDHESYGKHDKHEPSYEKHEYKPKAKKCYQCAYSPGKVVYKEEHYPVEVVSYDKWGQKVWKTVYKTQKVAVKKSGGWDKCLGPFDYYSANKYGVDLWDCKDNCYTRTDKKGNVYRGCYKNEWNVDSSKLGCHYQAGSLYCFCKGDKCNNRAVHRPQKSEFEAFEKEVKLKEEKAKKEEDEKKNKEEDERSSKEVEEQKKKAAEEEKKRKEEEKKRQEKVEKKRLEAEEKRIKEEKKREEREKKRLEEEEKKRKEEEEKRKKKYEPIRYRTRQGRHASYW